MAAEGRPLIIAHRGGASIAPENTLASFLTSARIGVDVLEFDARLSRDGHLVVIHDDRVDRTTNGQGEVAALSLSQLQALSVNPYPAPPGVDTPPEDPRLSQIPTVADIFEVFHDTPLRFIIEIKDDDAQGREAARALVQLAAQYGLTDRLIIASFSATPLATVREEGQVETSAAFSEATIFILLSFIGLENLSLREFSVLQLPRREMFFTEEFVARHHRNGIAVHYWTINDPNTFALLREINADGIMTDRPDLLRAYLGEYYDNLPSPITVSL